MIKQFGGETALLLVDVQKGVDVLDYWGGPAGRRNNPVAEENLGRLLSAWRQVGLPVFYTLHDSLEEHSPLKLSLPTGDPKRGLEPEPGEGVVIKQVNGGFFGTDLDLRMRRAGVDRLVIGGFFTNMCVDTTTRSAGNLGYDTYLVPDACATTNRVGRDGTDHDPEIVHQLAVASLHGEFCTGLDPDQAIGLTDADNPELERVQGNE